MLRQKETFSEGEVMTVTEKGVLWFSTFHVHKLRGLGSTRVSLIDGTKRVKTYEGWVDMVRIKEKR